jgi:branched-chain amino acid transport system substrate-binding protein
VAVLLLTACGGGDSNESSGGGGGEGGGGEPLVVAFPVPLTSGNAAAAEQMVNTAELAVKTINDDGGAGGRELQLEVYDDKLTADESAKIAQRALTQDGAEVIVGGYTSIEGLAIREVTERRKVVYIASSTISPQLTKDATYTFRQAHDQGDYPVQMAALYAELGYEKPVVVHDDGPTGSTLFGPIVSELEGEGLTPGEPVGFTLNSTDVSTAVADVAAQQPDSIIHVGSSGADAGLMLKTLAEQGIDAPVLGFGSLISAEALNIGGAAYEGRDVYTLANASPSKPEYKEFKELYEAEYGATTLVEQAPQTWDAFEVLRRALDETGGDASGDALAEAIHGLEPFEGAAGKAGGLIDYSDSQNAYRESLVPYGLEAGKPVELNP